MGLLVALGFVGKPDEVSNGVESISHSVGALKTDLLETNAEVTQSSNTESKQAEVSTEQKETKVSAAFDWNEVPDGNSTYIEHLEKEEQWSKNQATRVRLVTLDGEVVDGYKFAVEAAEGEERSNWKVIAKMPKELVGKENLSAAELVLSECCYVKDGKMHHIHGYSLVDGGIVPTTSEVLRSLSRWSLSEALISGLLGKDRKPVDGYKFAVEVSQGEERTDWRIVEESKK
jgi:hypothetical protein